MTGVNDQGTTALLERQTIVDPRGRTRIAGGVAVQELTGLKGKRLAIVTQGEWRSWLFFRDRLEAHLSGPGQDIDHRRWQDERPYKPERYDEIAQSADAAVIGLGNCGSCTATVAMAAAELASRGLPTLVVVTAGFETLAAQTLKFKGQGDVPLLVLPAAYEVMTEDELVRIADERVPEVELGLVRAVQPA